MINPWFWHLVLCLPFISSLQESINNQPHIPHGTLLDMGQSLEREICRDFASNFFGADLVVKVLLLQLRLEGYRSELCKYICIRVFFTVVIHIMQWGFPVGTTHLPVQET